MTPKRFTRRGKLGQAVPCVEVDGWIGEVHSDGSERPCEACAAPAPFTRGRLALRLVSLGYAVLDRAAQRWLAYPESAETMFDDYIAPEDAPARLRRWTKP